MKIKTKIMASFIAICAVFIVGSIFAIYGLSSIKDKDHTMYTQDTRGVDYSGRAANDIANVRLGIRTYEGTVYQMELNKSANFPTFDVSAQYNAVTSDFAEYKNIVTSDAENKLFAAAEKALADYKANIIDPISKAAGQKDAAKIHSVINNGTTYINALKTSITALTNYNVTGAKSTSDSNSALANTLFIALIAIIAAAVLFALVMAFLIIRTVMKPLGILMNASNKIAAGEMEIQLDLNRKDEFGELNISFAKLIDAVKAVMNDANMLSSAAVEGKLDTRVDTNKHKGDFRKVIEGINNTLDAIIEPINEVSAVMKEISNRNLHVSVKGNYKGSLGELKVSVNETTHMLETMVKELTYYCEEMAKGNLNIEKLREYHGDFSSISVAINTIIDSMNEVLSEINKAAEQVATGSTQVSDGSQELSQGATEQASSIEELSASITEIAAQTKQNAENAAQANRLALEAKKDADSGNNQMKLMSQSMSDINEASSNISKVIKVIDEIAFQTNILALNAAVEAARAGQYGKGFAVVAEEVRNLAAKSAEAAKETAAMIEGSIKKAEAGTRIAGDTVQALAKILTGVDKAASLVAEIASASNEQAAGIAQINQGIEQVSQVVQTNSATSEETAASSEELSSQAELLKEMVGNFSLRNDGGQKRPEAVFMPNPQKAVVAQAASTKQSAKIVLAESDYGKY